MIFQTLNLEKNPFEKSFREKKRRQATRIKSSWDLYWIIRNISSECSITGRSIWLNCMCWIEETWYALFANRRSSSARISFCESDKLHGISTQPHRLLDLTTCRYKNCPHNIEYSRGSRDSRWRTHWSNYRNSISQLTWFKSVTWFDL